MSCYGVEEIYTPINPKIDVVFVQGLFGDRKSAWTWNSPETQGCVFWPKELLYEDLPYARIMACGYEASVTDVSGELNAAALMNHANEISNSLVAIFQQQNNPIIFVASGLGGLICAHVIAQGLSPKWNGDLSTVASRTEGIVFLGTPLRETNTTYAEMLGKMATPSMTHEMREISDEIKPIADSFTLALKKPSNDRNIKVSFFCENRCESMVVPPENARLEGEGYSDPVEIEADHFNMTRFKSRDDKGYQAVMKMIKASAQEQLMEGKNSGGIRNTWNNRDHTQVGQQVGVQNNHGSTSFFGRG